MQNDLTKKEYDILLEVCKYWKYIYRIDEIDFDYIFSKCVLTFQKKKIENKIKAYSKKVSLQDKELLLRSFIKVMCQNIILNFIKSKKIKEIRFSKIENDNFINNLTNGKDAFDELLEQDVTSKISYMYSILSEKEQMLCDLLSTENYSKCKICSLLSISTNEYNNYILKIKKLLVLILENDY